MTPSKPRGSPRRSFRWHYRVFDDLYEMEADRNHKVTVNRIASVAIEWGLAFLRTLSPQLQDRVLGVKGVKPLTFVEQEKLRNELNTKLGSMVGQFRLDDRLAFALPKPAKELLREEAKKGNTTMSKIARSRIIMKVGVEK